VVTCLVIGCLAVLLVALAVGGCLGFGTWGAWQVGKAVQEQTATEERLRQAHRQLEASAAANGGAFPAEFECAGQPGAGAGDYVYVPGLRQDMPKGLVLVYRRYSSLGTARVAVVSIAGEVTELTAAEFDELLAAQEKTLAALKAGGKAAEDAVKEFEALVARQAAERKAREPSGGHHRHHDWD
jgi:hypothetical protein